MIASIQLVAQDRGLSVIAKQVTGSPDFEVGKQYAVIIGIDRYQEWPSLKSAVAEARQIRAVLSERYYIDEFIELYDQAATAASIRRLFAEELPKKISINDSLLLFYAGHGYLDNSKTGFWIASDGVKDIYDQKGWIPNAQLRNLIGQLKAQRVLVVADAWDHTLILKSDHTLWATGTNNYGQLGDSTQTKRSSPVLVMSDVSSMSAGNQYSMIVKNNGSLWACGNNTEGQLGDGTSYTFRTIPIQILTTGGSLKFMGTSTCGPLGATWIDIVSPAYWSDVGIAFTPTEIATGVASVSASLQDHVLYTKTDGSLWSFGVNTNGDLFDGTTTNKNVPIQVLGVGSSLASAGGWHSLVLKSDGSLWGAGTNSAGQLGNGTNTNSAVPIQMMTGVSAVSAGGYHSMMIKTDGSLWGVGENDDGELGDGTTTNRNVPVRIF